MTDNPDDSQVTALRERIAELETLYREQLALTETFETSEQRYRKIFDHSNDAILIVDPLNDEIIDFNAQACSLLEYSSEELANIRVSEIHPHDMDKLMEFGEVVLELGHGWTDQLTCRVKSGAFVAAEISASAIDVGDRTGLVVMVRDINRRKQMEQALDASEARYKTLAQENATLVEIGKAISGSVDIGEVFDRFSDEVGKLIPFDRLVISTVDLTRWGATIEYISGAEISSRGPGAQFSLSGTRSGDVVSQREGMAYQADEAGEFASQYSIDKSLTNAGLKSFMTLPLILSDHLVGLLLFGAFDHEAYTDNSLELAQRIADQIAGTVASTVTSESRLQAVLENVADGIITMNAALEIESINSAGARIFG